MHVRCDNKYKTGADRGNILGQPRLFECMGICVFSPANESKMRGYLVSVLIVKYLFHRCCLVSHSLLDWTALLWNLLGIFKNIFRGVFGPCHLQGLYSELALFYLLYSGHTEHDKGGSKDSLWIIVLFCCLPSSSLGQRKSNFSTTYIRK